MTAEAGPLGRERGALPGVVVYLRAIWDLGRRTLRPALPALAFMYFYRVGMGVYSALSADPYVAGSDPTATILPRLVSAAAIVPLLLLLYAPMLPLQDSLLRGQAISFTAAFRRTFVVSWNLTLSGILQGLFLIAPFVLLMVGLGLASRGLSETSPLRLAAVAVGVGLSLIWFVIGGLLMFFATPAVVLDGESPVRSVRTSLRLALPRFPGLLGRLLAFGALELLAYFVLVMPAAMLTGLEQAAGITSAPIRIAVAIWSSAVETITFPFSVAAMMVLYRALAPSADARGSAPVMIDEDYRHATATSAPFE